MPTITGSPSEKCSLALSTAYCHMNSSGDTGTKVRSEQSNNRGLNPQCMQEPFLRSVQTGSRANPASHPTVTVTEIGHGGKRRELEYMDLYCHFSDSSINKWANSSLTLLFILVSQTYRKRHATLLTSGLAHNTTQTKSYFLLSMFNHAPRWEDPRGKGESIVHAPAIFSLGTGPPFNCLLHPQTVFMFRRRENSLPLTGIEYWSPDHPSRNMVTILTTQWKQIAASPSVS
jgi:hypothetical protein